MDAERCATCGRGRAFHADTAVSHAFKAKDVTDTIFHDKIREEEDARRDLDDTDEWHPGHPGNYPRD